MNLRMVIASGAVVLAMICEAGIIFMSMVQEPGLSALCSLGVLGFSTFALQQAYRAGHSAGRMLVRVPS